MKQASLSKGNRESLGFGREMEAKPYGISPMSWSPDSPPSSHSESSTTCAPQLHTRPELIAGGCKEMSLAGCVPCLSPGTPPPQALLSNLLLFCKKKSKEKHEVEAESIRLFDRWSLFIQSRIPNQWWGELVVGSVYRMRDLILTEY